MLFGKRFNLAESRTDSILVVLIGNWYRRDKFNPDLHICKLEADLVTALLNQGCFSRFGSASTLRQFSVMFYLVGIVDCVISIS